MRTTMISTLFFLLALSCTGQDSVLKKSLTKDSYLKRTKDQRTGGFVLCAAGVGGLLVTAIADAGRRAGGAFVTIITLGSYEPEYQSYTGTYLVSGACFIGGLYLYSASSKNKRKAKAASLTIGLEETEMLKNKAFHKRSFPAVGLRVRV